MKVLELYDKRYIIFIVPSDQEIFGVSWNLEMYVDRENSFKELNKLLTNVGNFYKWVSSKLVSHVSLYSINQTNLLKMNICCCCPAGGANSL